MVACVSRLPGLQHYRNDGDAALMHVGVRYYDPEVGRFTTADTVLGNIYDPQTLNRYVYVNNNPVNLLDPSGRGPFLLGLVIIVAIIVFIVVVIVVLVGVIKQTYKNTEKRNKIIQKLIE